MILLLNFRRGSIIPFVGTGPNLADIGEGREVSEPASTTQSQSTRESEVSKIFWMYQYKSFITKSKMS